MSAGISILSRLSHTVEYERLVNTRCEISLTFTKWSIKLTWPIGPPSDIRRAYSPFLIEWTDTASVMVSTSPDVSPVIKMRKLRPWSVISLESLRISSARPNRDVQSDPAIALLLLPDPAEPLDELSRQLLLPQIRACLDDHRDDIPVGEMAPRRGGSYPALLGGP